MLRKSSFTLNFIHFSLHGFPVDQITETMHNKGGRDVLDGRSECTSQRLALRDWWQHENDLAA